MKFHLRYIAFVAGVEREKDREKGKKGGPIERLGARRDGWSGGKGRREEGESGEEEGERETERERDVFPAYTILSLVLSAVCH